MCIIFNVGLCSVTTYGEYLNTPDCQIYLAVNILST